MFTMPEIFEMPNRHPTVPILIAWQSLPASAALMLPCRCRMCKTLQPTGTAGDLGLMARALCSLHKTSEDSLTHVVPVRMSVSQPFAVLIALWIRFHEENITHNIIYACTDSTCPNLLWWPPPSFFSASLLLSFIPLSSWRHCISFSSPRNRQQIYWAG